MPTEHPGVILRREIKSQGLITDRAYIFLRWPRRLFRAFLGGVVPVSVCMAQNLAVFSGTSPEFWLNLQREYDEAIKEDGHDRR